MSSWRPLLDAALVARFELLRALRTWRALAMVMVYLVANVGGAYMFTRAVGEMENAFARSLGVAETQVPGTMVDRLVESDEFRRFIAFLVGGNDAMVDGILAWPLLAIFQLWLGLLLIPFFTATAASETLSIDMASRAVRFEALRTGRMELVLGRFLGQVVLSAVATLVGFAGVWIVGQFFMVGNDPVELAVGLFLLGGRAVFYGLPFVAVGIACSQLTTSPAWARVMALSAVSASWVAYGALQWAEDAPWTWIADTVLPLLPQTYVQDFWGPGITWLTPAGVCLAVSLAVVGLGFVRFNGRDL